jgi:bud site selection protein 31
MKKRAPQQKITPDVQTGCICCASGDGRFGGPIWWNTPIEDTEETAEENRAVWVQVGAGNEDTQQGDGEGAVAVEERHVEEEEEQAGAPVPSRKRPLEDDEDELDDDVKKRLAALRD